jgi:hypothetical protein
LKILKKTLIRYAIALPPGLINSRIAINSFYLETFYLVFPDLDKTTQRTESVRGTAGNTIRGIDVKVSRNVHGYNDRSDNHSPKR